MEQQPKIQGVNVKRIVRHEDARGYFAELFKKGEDGFHTIEQTSYSLTMPGVIKAFHYHEYWETWVVLRGEARMVMYDMREHSPTNGITEVVIAGEDSFCALSIPPGVAHGYQVLGSEPVGMLYHAGEAYDASRKHQIGTMPHDSPIIGFDWSV